MNERPDICEHGSLKRQCELCLRDAEIASLRENEAALSTPRKKVSHIGAPACFALEQALKHVRDAFDDCEDFSGIYVVGSCLERPDWRDIDVRMILGDEAFARLFPRAHLNGSWEFDPRWCLMTVAISKWLSAETGLPVDFQFQPMTFANERYKGPRHAAGLRFVSREPKEAAQ